MTTDSNIPNDNRKTIEQTLKEILTIPNERKIAKIDRTDILTIDKTVVAT
jgi:hypothetical protein